MATRRPSTIGKNPLKPDSIKSSKSDQISASAMDKAPAEKDVAKPKRANKPKPVISNPESQLPQQSHGTAARVKRSVKDTEALFEEQLRRDEPEAAKSVDSQKVQVSHVPESQQLQVSDRHREAMAIVKTWSQWAVVAGMTPVPLMDTLALSGTQIKLIQLLCKHYNVPFEHKVAIAVAAGLVGGTATSTIAAGITRSLMRNVPIAGQIFNWTVEPALSFGSTYAIGATFVRHFEANGNLMTFKGEQMKDYAAEQFQKGKKLFLSKKRAPTA